MNTFFRFLAAALCGALSGYGIGGGTLLTVYMTAIAHMAQNTAQGINLIYFIPASLAAIFFHVKNGLIHKRAFLFAASAGLILSAVTAHAAAAISPDTLRRAFGYFLIAIGCYMLLGKSKNAPKNGSDSTEKGKKRQNY